MEITREKYLEALEIIDLYHRQKDLIETDIMFRKLKVSEFIKFFNPENPSQTRLLTILKNHVYLLKNRPELKLSAFINDISKEEFMRHRNAGISSWNELEKIIQCLKDQE